MTRRVPRVLSFSLIIWLGCGLLARGAETLGEKTVFLAGGLTPVQLVELSANLSASRHPGTLLLDSYKLSPHHRTLLANLAQVTQFGGKKTIE